MALFIVNFKSYNEALGLRGEAIAKAAKLAADRFGVNIAIAPAFSDIRLFSNIVPVIAQHIDPVEPGAHTGSITAESVKEAGAIGTMINHSEKRIGLKEMETCIMRAKQNGLMVICCSSSPQESETFAKFKPDYILIEPPELIGGNNSISKTRPDVITETVRLVKAINESVGVICGAGVSSRSDSLIAKQLGAAGVAAASAIVKSRRPQDVIEDIASGLCSRDFV
ncbi:MAG: triose-phosphate isomerase [Candidatus Aenigmatarchaeota archaeon]